MDTLWEVFPKDPVIYETKNQLIGSTDDLLCPKSVKQFDYEGELALVIGKKYRKVTLKDALDYVAGYFIMNDISARDVQFTDRQYTMWTVASYPDGISDPSNLLFKDSVKEIKGALADLLKAHIKAEHHREFE